MTDQTAATPAPEEKAVTQPTKRSHKIVRWIPRRQRLLTFIGALIVFGTFVVKDALRERLKDLVDAIGNAENLFLTRTDSITITNELAMIGHELGTFSVEFQPLNLSARHQDRIVGRPNTTLTPTIPDEVLYEEIGIQERYCTQLKDSLQNSSRLAGSLPEAFQQMLLPRIEGTARKVNGVMNDLAALRDSVLHKRSDNVPDVFVTYQPITNIELEVEHTRQSVWDYARQVQQKNQHRYEIATGASWFLYALGWGLGLIGRLVGVETGVGE